MAYKDKMKCFVVHKDTKIDKTGKAIPIYKRVFISEAQIKAARESIIDKGEKLIEEVENEQLTNEK